MANTGYVTENRFYKNKTDIKEYWFGVGAFFCVLIGFIDFFIGFTCLIAVCIAFLIYRIKYYVPETFRVGARGEEYTLSLLKLLPDKFAIFNQVLIPNDRAEKGYNEIDFVIVGENAVFVVEVKNIKGVVCGHINERYWIKKHISSSGKEYEKKIYNPIYQVRHQANVLRYYFKKTTGIKLPVVEMVFFSHPEVKLNIDGINNSPVPIFIRSFENYFVKFIIHTDKRIYSSCFVKRKIIEELKTLKEDEKFLLQE